MLLDTDRHILNMKLDTDLPPLTTRQTTHIQKWGVNSKKLQKFGVESGFTAELLEEITHEHQRALNKIVLASCLQVLFYYGTHSHRYDAHTGSALYSTCICMVELCESA